MIKDYFQKLWGLWSKPADFFGDVPHWDRKESSRFAAVTGILLALELGLLEALGGGSLWIVALVTFLLLLVLPFLLVTGCYFWTHFMRLCAFLMGESLSVEKVVPVVSYSMAGLATLGLGLGLGKWLALSVFFFQFLGVENLCVVPVGRPRFSWVCLFPSLGFFSRFLH